MVTDLTSASSLLWRRISLWNVKASSLPMIEPKSWPEDPAPMGYVYVNGMECHVKLGANLTYQFAYLHTLRTTIFLCCRFAQNSYSNDYE